MKLIYITALLSAGLLSCSSETQNSSLATQGRDFKEHVQFDSEETRIAAEKLEAKLNESGITLGYDSPTNARIISERKEAYDRVYENMDLILHYNDSEIRDGGINKLVLTWDSLDANLPFSMSNPHRAYGYHSSHALVLAVGQQTVGQQTYEYETFTASEIKDEIHKAYVHSDIRELLSKEDASRKFGVNFATKEASLANTEELHRRLVSMINLIDLEGWDSVTLHFYPQPSYHSKSYLDKIASRRLSLSIVDIEGDLVSNWVLSERVEKAVEDRSRIPRAKDY